jgi:hypothetical protein
MRRMNNSSVFATVASARRQCHIDIVAEAQISFQLGGQASSDVTYDLVEAIDNTGGGKQVRIQ